jgi:hypothetical protein
MWCVMRGAWFDLMSSGRADRPRGRIGAGGECGYCIGSFSFCTLSGFRGSAPERQTFRIFLQLERRGVVTELYSQERGTIIYQSIHPHTSPFHTCTIILTPSLSTPFPHTRTDRRLTSSTADPLHPPIDTTPLSRLSAPSSPTLYPPCSELSQSLPGGRSGSDRQLSPSLPPLTTSPPPPLTLNRMSR